VGRIAYVKFTSVNLDYYSYLFYLLKQNNQQDKTKKPDIGHTNQNPRTIRSPLHVLPADFLIFLNFVLKIQIQYFLESECITNTWSWQVIKIQRKGSIRSSGRRLARAFCIFKPFTRNQNKSTLLFYSTFDLCSKFKPLQLNLWETIDWKVQFLAHPRHMYSQNTHTHPVHTEGGPRRPNCRAHFFGLTSTTATSLIFTPFTNYGDWMLKFIVV